MKIAIIVLLITLSVNYISAEKKTCVIVTTDNDGSLANKNNEKGECTIDTTSATNSCDMAKKLSSDLSDDVRSVISYGCTCKFQFCRSEDCKELGMWTVLKDNFMLKAEANNVGGWYENGETKEAKADGNKPNSMNAYKARCYHETTETIITKHPIPQDIIASSSSKQTKAKDISTYKDSKNDNYLKTSANIKRLENKRKLK